MAMKKAALLLGLCAVIVGLIPLPAAAGLKETIAEKFSIAPTSFVLNLPPRPGCLPGSIFTDDLRVPLSRTKLDDPDLQFGPPFHFTADISFDAGVEANVGVAEWFGAAAKA